MDTENGTFADRAQARQNKELEFLEQMWRDNCATIRANSERDEDPIMILCQSDIDKLKQLASAANHIA